MTDDPKRVRKSSHYHALRGELLHYGLRDLAAARRGRHANTQPNPQGGRSHPMLGRVDRLLERDMAATKRIFLFKTIEPIEIVDLSMVSGSGQEFIHELGTKDEIRKVLDEAGYSTVESAYASSGDHSFDRGIGNAIHDGQQHKGSLGGIVASTVRDAEVPAPSMRDNLVLFNISGVPERKLRVCQEFVFYGDSATAYFYDELERLVDWRCST